MKLRPLLWLALCGMALPAAAQPVRAYADSIRIAHHIPELAYGVVSPYAIVEMGALGRHSIALPDSASLDDHFHIGSNTKAMTAWLVAYYVERGKLAWDTKFFDRFPDLLAGSDPAYKDITLQDLLSHRARILPALGAPGEAIPEFSGDHHAQRLAFARHALSLPPTEADPETGFAYSNGGYLLATLMLEQATGKTWAQLVTRVLNRKARLHVGLSWPDNQRRKDTWGHSGEGDSLVPVPSTTDYQLGYSAPAGDIHIRMPDYLRFVQLQLRGLQANDKYMQAATYQHLHKGLPFYALGWFNSTAEGQDLSTHSGTAGTYFSLVVIDRERHVGFVIFVNAFNDDALQGVRALMRGLRALYSH